MLKNVTDALAGVVKDGSQRLIVLCLAVALTLAGVTRALFEMSVGGVGSFPMPGDNLLMLGVCLACCLAVSHWHRDVARFARTGAGRVFVTGFALVCLTLLQVCRVLDPVLGAQLLFFAGAFVRLSGLLMLVVVYARVDSRDMATLAAQMVWALGVSVVLDLVFLLLAPIGVAIVSLMLPLVAWVCLGKLDVTAGISGVADGTASRYHSPSSLEHASNRGEALHGVPCAKMPRLRLLTFGLYGAVGGLASSQAHALAPTVMAQPSLLHSCLVNDFGLVLGAGVLIVGTMWLVGRNVDPFALRSLLVPAFLVAIFLAPLLAGFMGEVVPVLMALSQALFYGMLWMFPKPAFAGERLRWFAAGCGAFFVGTHAGMWLGGDFLPASGAGDIYMVVAALALAVLIMVEFAPRLLGSYDGVAPADTSGTSSDEEDVPVCSEPAEAALEANAALDALAAHAADAWGLTPRERAVLPGLLRGRSVAWVAESLTVSKNTVHTHMRNIYQKAGVHSQEELIDAAEAL